MRVRECVCGNREHTCSPKGQGSQTMVSFRAKRCGKPGERELQTLRETARERERKRERERERERERKRGMKMEASTVTQTKALKALDN